MTIEPFSYPRHRFPTALSAARSGCTTSSVSALRDVELILAEQASWSPTKASGTGVGSSAPTSPGDCAGDDRRPAIRGTWARCPSASRGVLHQLWRAVERHGVILDILVQDRRNGGLPSGSPSPLAPPV